MNLNIIKKVPITRDFFDVDSRNGMRYAMGTNMIQAFADKDTQKLFDGEAVNKFRKLERIIRRKLEMIHASTSVQDLRSPPGNRLEKLGGDRIGQYSIRVNDQWRICFEWRDGNAHAVEIIDYH